MRYDEECLFQGRLAILPLRQRVEHTYCTQISVFNFNEKLRISIVPRRRRSTKIKLEGSVQKR